MRPFRVLVSLALCAAFLSACSSTPEDSVPAPERNFEVDAGTEVESRGSLMLRAKSLTESWLAAKSKTPRSIEIERRQAAIESALQDFAERHRAVLLEILRKRGPEVQRSSAALCLGFSAERRDEVLEALIGVLEAGTSEYVRSDVLVGLGTLAHPRTPLEPVMDVIEQGKIDNAPPASFSMRARAAFCMLRACAAGAGNPAIGDRIEARLVDRDEDLLVASQLARALAGSAVRTNSSIPVLVALLDHSAPRVVTSAITSLAEMRARSAGAELVAKLSDGDASVRIAAHAALRELYQRDEGADPAAWSRFLDELSKDGSNP
ncbi:MAG: HEAT repeat domain-containing protein [Planctomycetes bacterium]|nr:HEAT repeat domain-containing protein [Planctomycetota bacterium]